MKYYKVKASDNSFSETSLALKSFYALIALMFLLIPEWIAAELLALLSNFQKRKLPSKGIAWETNSELKLASMNMLELRFLASKLKIKGYSRQNREDLSRHLIKHMGKNFYLE